MYLRRSACSLVVGAATTNKKVPLCGVSSLFSSGGSTFSMMKCNFSSRPVSNNTTNIRGKQKKNNFLTMDASGRSVHHQHCQKRYYSNWLNWFKGSTDQSNASGATVDPSSSTNSGVITSSNNSSSSVIDSTSGTIANTNNGHAPNVVDDEELYRGLQLIHETPQHEYHAPLTFGEEHELFVGGHLPHSMPQINAIQDLLQYLHDSIGLPWFGAIMAATIMFRLLVLPLNIGLTRNSARLDKVRPILAEKAELMKSKTASEEDKVQAAVDFQSTIKENKCHPLMNIMSPLVMAPMFLSVFVSVERICLHDPGCRGMGGLWWFDDLSSVDPTSTLPVISAVTWLISVEMGAAEPRTQTMRQVRSVMRFVAAVMVPITGALPSGVFVYWITSNIFSMIQIYTLRLPAVRRFLGIPVKDQSETKDEDKTRDISM